MQAVIAYGCVMSDARATSSDPIFTTVDALVRDGTLDHAQADRVYAAMRSGLPRATTAAPPDAGAPAGGVRDIAAWSLPDRLAAAGALLGSGLALGGVLVSAYVAEGPDGDFPVKAFLVALGATVALAILTAAVHVVIPDRSYSRWFVAGPAGLGALALGFTIGIALSDWDQAGYAIGAVMLLGGAAGYVVVRSGAGVAVAVLGGLILFASLVSDLVPSDSDSLLWISVPAVLYGVGVAAAGWVLPTRHISAVLGGVVALGGVTLVLGIAAFARLIIRGILGVGGVDSGPDYTGDVATTLVLGVLVCLGLAGLYGLSGHPGYAVVSSLGAVVVILAGLFALDLEHTFRWAAIVAVAGAAGAWGCALLPLSRYRHPRPPRPASTVQPVPPQPYGSGQPPVPPPPDATQPITPPAAPPPPPPPPPAAPSPPPAAPSPPPAAPPTYPNQPPEGRPPA